MSKACATLVCLFLVGCSSQNEERDAQSERLQIERNSQAPGGLERNIGEGSSSHARSHLRDSDQLDLQEQASSGDQSPVAPDDSGILFYAVLKDRKGDALSVEIFWEQRSQFIEIDRDTDAVFEIDDVEYTLRSPSVYEALTNPDTSIAVVVDATPK